MRQRQLRNQIRQAGDELRWLDVCCQIGDQCLKTLGGAVKGQPSKAIRQMIESFKISNESNQRRRSAARINSGS